MVKNEPFAAFFWIYVILLLFFCIFVAEIYQV